MFSGIDHIGLFIAAGLLLNLTRRAGARGRGRAGHHGRLFCAHRGSGVRGKCAGRRVCHGLLGAEMAGCRVPGVRGLVHAGYPAEVVGSS